MSKKREGRKDIYLEKIATIKIKQFCKVILILINIRISLSLLFQPIPINVIISYFTMDAVKKKEDNLYLYLKLIVLHGYFFFTILHRNETAALLGGLTNYLTDRKTENQACARDAILSSANQASKQASNPFLSSLSPLSDFLAVQRTPSESKSKGKK